MPFPERSTKAEEDEIATNVLSFDTAKLEMFLIASKSVCNSVMLNSLLFGGETFPPDNTTGDSESGLLRISMAEKFMLLTLIISLNET